MWALDDSFAQAKAALANSPTIRPTERLYLARKFRISEWIEGAFIKLVQTRFRDLTDDDIHWLKEIRTSSDPVRALAALIQDLSALRSAWIVHPAPTIEHLHNCTQGDQCQQRFTTMWKTYMQYFHKANFAYDGHAVLKELETAMLKEIMSPVYDCIENTISNVKKKGTLWKAEERMLLAGRLEIVGE